MKRIGTVSSSTGLIFLGVWMIINKNNQQLGQEVIKWWPVIIIILGLEILFHFSFKHEDKAGFNFLVIPIIIIYLFINVFQGMYIKLGNLTFPWKLNDVSRYVDEFDVVKHDSFNGEKVLKDYGDKIYFEAENANVRFYKSSDENIKLNYRVYITKSRGMTEYKINEVKEKDGYKLLFNDGNVRRVEMDLYIPDNKNIEVNCSNLSIKNEDNVKLQSADIRCGNGSIKLSGAETLNLDINNGSIKLEDIKNIKVNGNNCSFDVSGIIEKLGIYFENGKIDIEGDSFKSIDIAAHIGSVNIDTREQDVSLKVDLNGGAIKANGEKLINSDLERIYGKGTRAIKIKVNQGSVSFNNRE